MLPQPQVGDEVTGGVIVDGRAGDLHDARLDGVHQREVADRPREDVALVVAGAAEVVRGCRQVVDPLDAGLASDCLQPAEPHPCVGIGLLLLAGELGPIDSLWEWLVLVAVMCLVAEHHYRLAAGAEVTQHPGHHRVGCLAERIDALTSGQNLASRGADSGDLLCVARQEGVVIGDDELRVPEGAGKVGRHQFALVVVVAGVIGDEHPKPVADRDPRGDDQEPLGEPRVARARHLVGRLPGDEHRHHHCLAGAGRHLQRDAREPGVVVCIGVIEPAPPVGVAVATGHLGQEDRGLRCLALAVENPVLPGRVGPVLEQLSRRRRDPLVVAVPPSLDLAAQIVDHRVAFAALAGQLDVKGRLDCAIRLLGAFPAGRDRDQGLARASAVLDHARRAVRTELEVTDRYVVRPVQDRIGERIYGSVVGAHRSSSLAPVFQ